MKICLLGNRGELNGLQCKLELQGHEVSQELDGKHYEIVVKESEEIPQSVIDSLDIETAAKNVDYCVSRFYGPGGWGVDSLLSLPFNHLLPNQLGPRVTNGVLTSRSESPVLSSLCEHERLETFLKLSGHFGFVTFGMNGLDKVSLHLGLPFYGFYNFLQMSRGTLVERLACEPTRLTDKFQVSLLLSRFPWPLQQCGKKIWVEVPEKAQEHFWPWAQGKDFVGRSFQTNKNIIGVATAYGNTIEHAMWFAETTCSYVHVENKVFFYKGWEEIQHRWDQVQKGISS